jgi:uncharacterized protein (TIGR00251 family)
VSGLESLYLDQRDDGLLLKVRVVPGSSRELIAGVHGDALKIKISAAPEKGKANRALRKLLAHSLSIPMTSILLVSGTSSQDKMVRISGLDSTRLTQLLSKLIPN